jgi:hypothetical protein
MPYESVLDLPMQIIFLYYDWAMYQVQMDIYMAGMRMSL